MEQTKCNSITLTIRQPIADTVAAGLDVAEQHQGEHVLQPERPPAVGKDVGHPADVPYAVLPPKVLHEARHLDRPLAQFAHGAAAAAAVDGRVDAPVRRGLDQEKLLLSLPARGLLLLLLDDAGHGLRVRRPPAVGRLQG